MEKNNLYCWETVATFTQRMRIKQGWLYKYAQGNSVAMVFVQAEVIDDESDLPENLQWDKQRR